MAMRLNKWMAALLFIPAAAGVFVVTWVVVTIFERKMETRRGQPPLVEVSEDDTDPAQWGANWPRQYDRYRLTAVATRTRFGGHGGSEALPEQKIERDPWLQRMFRGYAFSIDYRDRRGHAYMLHDQQETRRLTKPQSGSCLHCHASIMPLYRQLGGGDAMAGFESSYRYTYQELTEKLYETGGGEAHPVSCVDCHQPGTMRLRVTRPGFLQGIAALAASEAAVPHLPSVQRWRAGSQADPYDPNELASHTEMRSFACAQCHVEYYCGTDVKLTFPWGKGLRAEDIEAYWNDFEIAQGERFLDYRHAETGAPVLKAQHPEFELWSQGIHARSGVACADCHMPYMRDGAAKVSDHWVRSPLLNVNRACQVCHSFPEDEITARVETIQQRNFQLLQRAGAALMSLLDAIMAAREALASHEDLAEALEMQRKAQWRLDFIVAENSMGFHAPQEAARILGEATDFARQGELAAVRWLATQAAKDGDTASGPTAGGSVGGSGHPEDGAEGRGSAVAVRIKGGSR